MRADLIKTNILALKKSGKLPQVIMLEGASLKERWDLARDLAATVLGDEKVKAANLYDEEKLVADFYPLHRLKSTSSDKLRQSIITAQVEKLLHSLSFRPYSHETAVAIISEGDKLEPNASNKLLKTLEELYRTNYVFILTSNRDELLKTIVSRSVVYTLFCDDLQEDSETLQAISSDARKLLDISIEDKAHSAQVYDIISEYSDNNRVQTLLTLLESMIRDKCMADDAIEEYQLDRLIKSIDLIAGAKKDIALDMNKKYVLKGLFLELKILFERGNND